MADISWDGRRGKDSTDWSGYGSLPSGGPSPDPISPGHGTAPTFPTTAAGPSAQPTSQPFQYTGFGSYKWQQDPAGQDFYNRLKSYFPELSDADLSANLNFDKMPDLQYQQALINNFAAHPKQTTNSTNTSSTTTNSGNVQNDWMTFIRGKAPNYQTFRSTLPQLVDEFNKQYGYGIKATGRPDDYDTIQLPDGSIIDVHSSGGDYIWNPEGAGGSGGAGAAGSSGAAGAGGDDPMRVLYQLMSLARVGKLSGAPYTAGEDAALRAHYMDPLTQARDAALTRNKERIGSRGMLPTSGLLDHLNADTERGYESAVGGASNDTAIRAIDESQRRQDEQLQILDALLGEGRSYRTEQHGYDQTDFLNQIAQLNALVNAGGSGSDATNLLQQILSIGNANQNAQQIANSNRQSTSSAWGSLLPYILQAAGLGPTAAR